MEIQGTIPLVRAICIYKLLELFEFIRAALYFVLYCIIYLSLISCCSYCLGETVNTSFPLGLKNNSGFDSDENMFSSTVTLPAYI